MENNLFCNACGRKIEMKNGVLQEDIFEGKKEWGYFSDKDLEIHDFNICEKCYNKMIKQFVVPIRKNNKKEAL